MRSTSTRWILVLALGAALPNICAAQSPDLVDELKSCARMDDRDARIGCYETLGQRALREDQAIAEPPAEIASDPEPVAAPVATAAVAETAAAAPVATATVVDTTAAGAQPLPDDIGGADFEDPAEKPAEEYASRLSSCTKGRDSRWVFYFENGQIWKQSDYRRARFTDCDGIATISKDRFGYRLQMEGNDRTVRVSRRQ